MGEDLREFSALLSYLTYPKLQYLIRCADGGGIRGLAELGLLKAIFEHINIDRPSDNKLQPWQIFNLMTGTNSGGSIAIMLGRLRMSIDECEFEYKAILQTLYATKTKHCGLRQLLGGPMFDSKVYEAAVKAGIRNKLERESGIGNIPNSDDAIFQSFERLREAADELLFQDSKQRCKVCVLTKVVNEPNVTQLRSYQRPKSRDYLSENLHVSEACLATSSAPSFFPAFYHKRSGLQLVDPSNSFNDFLSLTILEAQELWPGRSLLVIHIGTDLRPSTFHIDSHRLYHFDIDRSCSIALDDYYLNPTRYALASQPHPEWCRQVDLVGCAAALGRSWTLTSDEKNCIRSLSSNGMRTRRDDIRPPVENTCSALDPAVGAELRGRSVRTPQPWRTCLKSSAEDVNYKRGDELLQRAASNFAIHNR